MEGKSAEPGDDELLSKAAHGDARAFHALITRHEQRLFAIAVALVGNRTDAEDVLQESAIGAFRGMGGFESRSSVTTWLTRIVVIQSAKWRRDRKRHQMDALPNAASTNSPVVGANTKIDLQVALQKLSPEHREVLVLREFEQMSYEEMAVVLGVPRGTVESRLHRARTELRECLKDYKS